MKVSFSPFASSVVTWFGSHGRDLPWRHTRDAYQIWLSEVILQQTRVDQGRDYWLRFVRRWPSVEALASATEDEVLREWQGLGYYSRARHLLAAARQAVAEGGFPSTYEGLLRLPGVGAYTAAAIASFAFDEPRAVVDGNVYRVLARHWAVEEPIDTTEGKRLFAALAQELLPAGAAAEYNQAIMDFGALVCTPTQPSCLECPVADSCCARERGMVEHLPVKKGRTLVQELRLEYYYIRCKGDVAIHRRGKGSFWQGLWEPYLFVEGNPAGVLTKELRAQSLLLAKGIKHVLSHRRLFCDLYYLEVDSKPALGDEYLWVAQDDLDRYAKPRLVEILLERVVNHLSPT